jgi:hypothetical protein
MASLKVNVLGFTSALNGAADYPLIRLPGSTPARLLSMAVGLSYHFSWGLLLGEQLGLPR